MAKTEPIKGLLDKLASPTDARPEGWKTLAELMEIDPMPETTARALINGGIKAGSIEVKKLKSPIGGGHFATRLNYREKP
jgi:hypothetical protein